MNYLKYRKRNSCRGILRDTEGSKRLIFPDFETIGTRRWYGSQLSAKAVFTSPPPGDIPGTHFCLRPSITPEP